MRKPMKAHTLNTLEEIPKEWWGMLCQSVKLDGIRGFQEDGVTLSNTRKPLPNRYMQSIMSNSDFHLLDGELVVGSPNAPDVYNRTQSGIMSRDGEPDFRFYAFDTMQPDIPFHERIQTLWELEQKHPDVIRVVQQNTPETVEHAEKVYQDFLEEGFEGIILRRIDGGYKFGRSTFRQGWLMKLKPKDRAEGVIIGVDPQLKNCNPATLDEFGHTERSSHQDNLIPQDLVGRFRLLIPGYDLVCGAGSGLTLPQRRELWPQRHNLLGKIVTGEFLPIGVKDRPRQMIFKGFRDVSDLSSDHPILEPAFQEQVKRILEK